MADGQGNGNPLGLPEPSSRVLELLESARGPEIARHVRRMVLEPGARGAARAALEQAINEIDTGTASELLVDTFREKFTAAAAAIQSVIA